MAQEKQAKVTERQQRILESTFIGLLSTIRHTDGRVSTNPVSYIWNGEEIEVSTLKERMKYKNLLVNSQATFCVVCPENHMNYVELRGTVRIVDDLDREYQRQQFRKLSGQELPDDLDPPGAERVVLYLRPEQVSSPVLYGGRFDDMAEEMARDS